MSNEPIIIIGVEITHNGPQELRIELCRTFNEKAPHRYFVATTTENGSPYPTYKYLHADGQVRYSTQDENNQSTGWFESLDKVSSAIKNYIKLKEQDSLSEVKAADDNVI